VVKASAGAARLNPAANRQTSATPSDKIARILCSLFFFHNLLFPIPIPKP
jgi:hypothetical protein